MQRVTSFGKCAFLFMYVQSMALPIWHTGHNLWVWNLGPELRVRKNDSGTCYINSWSTFPDPRFRTQIPDPKIGFRMSDGHCHCVNFQTKYPIHLFGGRLICLQTGWYGEPWEARQGLISIHLSAKHFVVVLRLVWKSYGRELSKIKENVTVIPA